jgi:hypothetical protein
MGSKIFGAFTFIILGVITADVLAHPAGTVAASNGVSNILKPSYNALLGYKS